MSRKNHPKRSKTNRPAAKVLDAAGSAPPPPQLPPECSFIEVTSFPDAPNQAAATPTALDPRAANQSLEARTREILDELPSAHLNRLNEDMAITREGCRLDTPDQRTLHDAYYHELFTIYVKCGGDMLRICELSGLFPGAVMEWLDQPHVMAAIARFRAQQEFAGSLKTLGALFGSIDHLSATADSAASGTYEAPASPPERRRAATSLSKAAANLSNFLKPSRAAHAANREVRSHNEEPARPRAGGGSVSTAPLISTSVNSSSITEEVSRSLSPSVPSATTPDPSTPASTSTSETLKSASLPSATSALDPDFPTPRLRGSEPSCLPSNSAFNSSPLNPRPTIAPNPDTIAHESMDSSCDCRAA